MPWSQTNDSIIPTQSKSMKQKCKPKGSTGSARIVLCWVWRTRREYSSPWQLRFRVTWRQEQNNSNYSVWLQITETARDTWDRNLDTTKRKGLPNNPIGLRHLKSLKLFNLFYKSSALLLEIQWSCTHAWTLQASFILQGKNQESFMLSDGKELVTQWGQTSDKTTNWVR